jgi:hypothetical protein
MARKRKGDNVGKKSKKRKVGKKSSHISSPLEASEKLENESSSVISVNSHLNENKGEQNLFQKEQEETDVKQDPLLISLNNPKDAANTLDDTPSVPSVPPPPTKGSAKLKKMQIKNSEKRKKMKNERKQIEAIKALPFSQVPQSVKDFYNGYPLTMKFDLKQLKNEIGIVSFLISFPHSSFFILHSSFFILHSSFFILHSSFFIFSFFHFFFLHSSFFILLSPFSFLLSPFSFLLSPFSFLLSHPYPTSLSKGEKRITLKIS